MDVRRGVGGGVVVVELLPLEVPVGGVQEACVGPIGRGVASLKPQAHVCADVVHVVRDKEDLLPAREVGEGVEDHGLGVGFRPRGDEEAGRSVVARAGLEPGAVLGLLTGVADQVDGGLSHRGLVGPA